MYKLQNLLPALMAHRSFAACSVSRLVARSVADFLGLLVLHLMRCVLPLPPPSCGRVFQVASMKTLAEASMKA
jgi:hypothetical protein